MHYREGGDNRLIRFSFLFDFDSVKAHMGLDRSDVMDIIENYDYDMADLKLDGYITLCSIIEEAVSSSVAVRDYRQDHLVVDYFRMLDDMVNGGTTDDDYTDEELAERSRNVGEGSYMLQRIHNIFMFGFIIHLDRDVILTLSETVVDYQDLPDNRYKDEIILTDSTITIYGRMSDTVDEELYEENEYYRDCFDRCFH